MSVETTEETRINVRVRGPMAAHVHNVIGPQGMYESQSEYIRDLIRRDMGYSAEAKDMRRIVRNGFAQLGMGDFEEATEESHEEIYQRAMARVQNSAAE